MTMNSQCDCATKEHKTNDHQCGEPCEVWSRVTGYFRPVKSWNKGKKEEFKDSTPYKIQKPKPTIRKIDEGYDPQTGIEHCTYAIN